MLGEMEGIDIARNLHVIVIAERYIARQPAEFRGRFVLSGGMDLDVPLVVPRP